MESKLILSRAMQGLVALLCARAAATLREAPALPADALLKRSTDAERRPASPPDGAH